MASTGNRRPRLVADRRTPAPRTQASRARSGGGGKGGGKGGGGRGPNGRKPAKRRQVKKTGNWFTRFFGGILRFIWRVVWGVFWRVTAIATLVMAAATFYFYTTMPSDLTEMLDGRARGSVTMRDADGEVFAWRGETFGGYTSSDSVSPHLRNAIVATEDRRFYWHFGVSPRGIAGAIRSNLAQGRGPFSGAGGSTITQQVSKLLCLGVAFDPEVWDSEADYESDCREGTIWRKIQELPYAFALELRFTKAEILTIYINRAFLGAGSRGFEAAAERYFGHSAAQVDAAEAAMLAGLLVAPSYYAPTRNLGRAQERANIVLGLMAEEDYLTDAELAEARANPAELHEAAETSTGGFFADWVMQSGPAWLTRDTTEDVLIQTTLDQRVQLAAQDALQQVFMERVRDDSVAEASVLVMSADGAVRAMVGGRSYTVGGFNRATQARRQTGSAFKPFVYALAMDVGYQPYDLVEDAPLTINVPGSGPWSPRNYSRRYLGFMTLTEALARSQNVPAVRISEAMGRENVRQAANAFGLHSDLAEGPALALGASEATLLEMTAAFAGILNGGSSVQPYGFTSLTLAGEREPLLRIGSGIGERVISEEAAQQLIWMMSQVIEAPYGTGRRAALPDGREAAGKTGTTQGARDAWFVGFTADYVVGVWMGNDDNSPLSGVTGGGLPAEIWRETMVRIHDGLPQRPLPMVVPERPELDPPTTRDSGGGQSGGGSLSDSIMGVLNGILGGN
ncbi:transglycosylase domain-containing protein [Pararhodobacter oceanensis]|uniref:peptidoglycan glycosyltransferase n=1 Tax=Pararhodobacter oceanensis TaxID=2172121 RepID=A0A2T8HVB2_9RHOB|nr:transglycosylase domain-containing protein [Pararhodobacter oceanensis]PVH29262.1 glycosyl transferase [Pararhodobacter oceanensis]